MIHPRLGLLNTRPHARASSLRFAREVLTKARQPGRRGVRSCWCGRTWRCPECGDDFKCWNTWPILWALMPARLRRKKICRRCYAEQIERFLDTQKGR